MRPLPVTFLAVLFGALAVSVVIALSLQITRQFMMPAWWVVLVGAQGLVCALGLWLMRRWVFLLFAIAWLAGALLLLLKGGSIPLISFIGPVLMAAVGVAYWRRFA
jgi:hypothetical protein